VEAGGDAGSRQRKRGSAGEGERLEIDALSTEGGTMMADDFVAAVNLDELRRAAKGGETAAAFLLDMNRRIDVAGFARSIEGPPHTPSPRAREIIACFLAKTAMSNAPRAVRKLAKRFLAENDHGVRFTTTIGGYDGMKAAAEAMAADGDPEVLDELTAIAAYQCFLCKEPFADQAPQDVVIVERPGAQKAFVTALCEACAARPDKMRRVDAVLEKALLGARSH
jgi:hypothetical protein